jgi:hypothetical protein
VLISKVGYINKCGRYTILNRKANHRRTTSEAFSQSTPSDYESDSAQGDELSHDGIVIKEEESVSQFGGFEWNHHRNQHHLAVPSAHMVMSTVGEPSLIPSTTLDDMQDVKPAAWVNDSFPAENGNFVSEQQQLQSHMQYPSYFAENQNWTENQKHNITIPAGYPSTMTESQPEILGATAPHNLTQPKLEPYESPRAHRQTIDLQDLDISSQTALFNIIKEHKRRATLIIE